MGITGNSCAYQGTTLRYPQHSTGDQPAPEGGGTCAPQHVPSYASPTLGQYLSWFHTAGHCHMAKPEGPDPPPRVGCDWCVAPACNSRAQDISKIIDPLNILDPLLPAGPILP